MEKEILNIFENSKFNSDKRNKDMNLANFLNSLDDLDKERLKNDDYYDNEIAKLLNISNE